jgi:tetratricopeptide (TPR) repeat protein
MRRINWKFAGILLLVLVSVTGGGHLLHIAQTGRAAAGVLELARKCRDEGQTEPAIKYIAQYLEFRPADAAAMRDLAGLFVERAKTAPRETLRKQYGKLLDVYERILRLDPSDAETRLKAVDYAILLYRFADALGHLDYLLRERPADADLLTRCGYCQQMVGKIEAATDYYQRAMKADPKKVSAYVYYAGLLQNPLKRTDEARTVLDQAVAAAPQGAEAYLGRAQFLRSLGKIADAATDIRQAVQLKPADAGILQAAAEIEQLAGNSQAARAHFQEGYRLFPTNTKFLTAVAWNLFYEGKTEEAVAALNAGRKANPKDIDVLTLLLEMYAQNGQLAELEKTLGELKEAKPAAADRALIEHHTRAMLFGQARLAMRRGQWAAAQEAFTKLRDQALRTPTLFRQANALLAQCASQLNDTATELDAYRRILEADPNAVTVRLDYARACARGAKHDDAREQFLVAVVRTDAPGRWVAETARQLFLAARADAAARQTLSKAVDGLRAEQSPNVLLAKAELNLDRNTPRDSLPAIEKALETNQRNAALHLARATLLDRLYGSERALAALAEAEKYAGQFADFRIAKARLYAARMDPAASEALLALGQGLERYTVEDRVRILQELVLAFRSIGAAGDATSHLELLTQTRPDHLIARELLAATSLRTGATERRQAALREIAAVEGPDGPTSRRAEALRLLYEHTPGDANGLAKARGLLEGSLKLQKCDPAAEFLLGRLDELAGNTSSALAHYKIAVELHLLDAPCEELFACAVGRAGTLPVAILRDRLPLADHFNVDRHRTVILAAMTLYDDAARGKLAETLAAKADAGDAAELTNLGRLFTRLGLTQQAEIAFRRAYQAAPESPEGWAALVTARANQNDAAGLQAAIAEVRKGMAAVDANLLVGSALAAAGKFDAARAEFERAAALNPDDTRPLRRLTGLAMAARQPDDARAMLQKLIAMPRPSSADDVRWARRNLAVSLVAYSQSKTQFERARQLVMANAVNGDFFEDDQRALVVILASQKSLTIADGVTARQEAIRQLEALAAKGTRTADDVLMLARLYRAENDLPRTQEARTRLKTEFADHYAGIAYLARQALAEYDLDECGRLLPLLRKLGPGQLGTVAIDFHYQVLSGAAPQGLRLLDTFVAAGESADEQTRRGVLVADLVSELLGRNPLSSRPDVASALRQYAIRRYDPLVDKDPRVFQRTVALLCEDDKTSKATDIVQRYRRLFPDETVAEAKVVVQRKGRGVNQQQTEQFLRELLASKPTSLGLRLALADFYDYAGRHEESIRLYREVLAKDPTNVAALNNLAWVLSYDRRETQRITEALARIEKAIDLAGPLDELLDTRARILFEAGRPESALRDLNEAICETPSAQRFADLAAMLRRAGKSAEADKVFAEAKRQGLISPEPR